MRPDQHKKKKNSEYKKKHGIPSEKGEKHDKKGSTSRNRSGERPTSDESKTGLETDGIDVEEKSSSHNRGSFSRRKVESNWDRYKEDDFEDESESNYATPSLSSVPIGADFQSLLDNATNESSHFQFKSEKEWENLNTDELNNKDGPSLLSIDCHVLAQSLRNIPLEQRLDLDMKYSMEEEYCGSAASKSQVDKPAINHQINNQETTTINSQQLRQNMSPNNINFSFSQPNKLTNASYENEKDKYPIEHKLKSPEQKIQDHSTDSERLESNTEKVQHNAQSRKSDVEDELELLLGIDSGKLVDATQKTQSASDTKEDLEDWLDSILD